MDATRFLAIFGMFLAFATTSEVSARTLPSVARVAALAAVALPEEQVESIRRRIARWREDRGIPGLAVALVIRGEILLVDGFGVDPDARLPIGSVENALRAVVTATEVDKGLLRWDSPLEESLGQNVLTIRSLDDSARVTWQDVLLHQTGLVGMDLLAGDATMPTDQILHFNVKRAEPWADFRARVLPNDGLWLTIEEALSRRAGADWESLLYERLTGPLGMHATTARRSSATDLARFVRFLLGDGIVDGRVIVARSTLDDLFRERATDEDGVAYGFGFATGAWEDRRIVTSIGSRRDSARIVLLPDADVGAVAIWTGWSGEITLRDFEALWPLVIGEWVEGLEPFIGRYVANYGRFRDAVFRVHVKDERLHVNIPGEQDYRLKWPGPDGRWTYEVSDQVAVSFDRDDDGSVVQMRLHMDGVEIELPREGTVNPNPLPEELVAPLLGSYRSADYLRDVRVDLDGGVLFLDWPDWSIVELEPTRVDGVADPWQRWRFELLPERALRFERNADGAVVAMVLLDEDRELERLPRVSDEPPPGLPTRKDLLALRASHSDATAFSSGTWRFTGTARRPQAGVAGAFRWEFESGDEHAWSYDFGPYGRIVPDESNGRPAGPHPAVLFGAIGEAYPRMRAVRHAEVAGRSAVVTELSNDALHVRAVAAFDEANGDLLRFESEAGSLFAGPSVWRFSDWKTVEGVRVPFRFEGSNDHFGSHEIEIASLERVSEDDVEEAIATQGAPVIGEPLRLSISNGDVRLFGKRLVESPGGVPRPIVLCVPPRAYRGRVYFDFGLRGRSILDDLARRGFDVFVVDAIESGRPLRASDLGEIVEYLEQRSGTRGVRLVGVAEGARVAVELAAAAAERVERLVVFGLPVATDDPSSGEGVVDHARLRSATRLDLSEERVAPDVVAELTIARWKARSSDVAVERDPDDPSAVDADEASAERTAVVLPDPTAIGVPLLVVDGQWEFEVPGQAADESEVAMRARRRDEVTSWFGRVPSRVKSRERIIGAGLFAPFGMAAGAWRDAVGAFLETPIERSLDVLAARLRSDLESMSTEGGDVPVVRFRLPDGRDATVTREADALAEPARMLPPIEWFEPVLMLRAAVDHGIVGRDVRVADWLADDPSFQAIEGADSMTIGALLDHEIGLADVHLPDERTEDSARAALERLADAARSGDESVVDASGLSATLVLAARLVDAWPTEWQEAARGRGDDDRDAVTIWRGGGGVAALLDRERGTSIIARLPVEADFDARAREWLDALHRP